MNFVPARWMARTFVIVGGAACRDATPRPTAERNRATDPGNAILIEGLLPLGQLRWLGSEGGGQRVALNEKGVDGATGVAGDEEFELCAGEEAVLCERVLEAADGLPGLRDGIVRPGAIRGANEAHDGIALLQVPGRHALHIMRGRVEAGLDDRLDASLAENLGDSLREGCQPGGWCGR